MGGTEFGTETTQPSVSRWAIATAEMRAYQVSRFVAHHFRIAARRPFALPDHMKPAGAHYDVRRNALQRNASICNLQPYAGNGGLCLIYLRPADCPPYRVCLRL